MRCLSNAVTNASNQDIFARDGQYDVGSYADLYGNKSTSAWGNRHCAKGDTFRIWSNYTWHGDQAPGQPWVRGLQNSETDFNDLRFSKLIIMNGKNLVENKMAGAHWFVEAMERGAKIVVIAPEYGAPSTKAVIRSRFVLPPTPRSGSV